MLKEFKSIFPYLKKYKFNYIVGIICLLVVDAAQVMIPRFTKIAVDVIASGHFSLAQVIKPALGMVGVAAVISIGRYFWRYFIIGASRNIETELRDKDRKSVV